MFDGVSYAPALRTPALPADATNGDITSWEYERADLDTLRALHRTAEARAASDYAVAAIVEAQRWRTGQRSSTPVFERGVISPADSIQRVLGLRSKDDARALLSAAERQRGYRGAAEDYAKELLLQKLGTAEAVLAEVKQWPIRNPTTDYTELERASPRSYRAVSEEQSGGTWQEVPVPGPELLPPLEGGPDLATRLALASIQHKQELAHREADRTKPPPVVVLSPITRLDETARTVATAARAAAQESIQGRMFLSPEHRALNVAASSIGSSSLGPSLYGPHTSGVPPTTNGDVGYRVVATVRGALPESCSWGLRSGNMISGGTDLRLSDFAALGACHAAVVSSSAQRAPPEISRDRDPAVPLGSPPRQSAAEDLDRINEARMNEERTRRSAAAAQEDDCVIALTFMPGLLRRSQQYTVSLTVPGGPDGAVVASRTVFIE